MEDLTKLITNVGFPIAVAVYLLVRIEGKLTALTDSINKLSSIINYKIGDSSDSNIKKIG